MPRTAFRIFITPFVFLLTVEAGLRADVTRFDLSGTMRDGTGGVLPGVTITLKNAELVTVEPTVAVTHELDGHGVDPRVTRLLTRCERGQLPVVGAGQMLVDVSDL